MRWPIVRTMRHPPNIVPSAIALYAAKITQVGMVSIDVTCRNCHGESAKAACAEKSSPR